MSCIRFLNVLDSRSLGPEPEAWLFLRHIGQAMNILAFAGVSEKVKVVFLLMETRRPFACSGPLIFAIR